MTQFFITSRIPAPRGGFRTFVFETDRADTVATLAEILNAGNIVAGHRISRRQGGARVECALGKEAVGEINPAPQAA